MKYQGTPILNKKTRKTTKERDSLGNIQGKYYTKRNSLDCEALIGMIKPNFKGIGANKFELSFTQAIAI